MDCPECQALMLVEAYQIEEMNSAGEWVPTTDVYECRKCQKVHPADLYENDGSGVVRVKEQMYD